MTEDDTPPKAGRIVVPSLLADAEKMELADLKSMADGLIYTITKSIELGLPTVLDSVIVGALLDACDDLKEACTASDRDRIVARIEELVRLTNHMASRFRDL